MSASHTATQGRLWFVRRGEVVRGPFQTVLVKRYLLLGRLQQSDELSLDREVWQAVSSYPMFSPERLADDSATVLLREDERKPVDRRHGEAPDNPYKERRSGIDRRAQETPEVLARRQRRARVVASLKPTRQNNLLPAIVAVVLVAGIAISGFLFKPTSGLSVPACDAAAAPGVNWSNCRKEEIDLHGMDMRKSVLRNVRLTGANLSAADLSEADLSYSDLVGANLGAATLTGATVKGVDLRRADLSNASFTGADLSYADLSDATIDGAALGNTRLDNAIWVNGKVCAPGSLGECL